jgi:hypothetical protein
MNCPDGGGLHFRAPSRNFSMNMEPGSFVYLSGSSEYDPGEVAADVQLLDADLPAIRNINPINYFWLKP